MRVFLQGGGDMSRAINDHDWAATPLGPIEDWPVSLKTVVRMVLKQKYAICFFWGPELTMLYNDAYTPVLGAKEKGALGQPFDVIWADVWEAVKPFVDKALSGEGAAAEDLKLIMTRNGFAEETFWSFCYSPLHDDAGKVAGLINIAIDMTEAVRAKRAQDAYLAMQEKLAASDEVLRRELIHRVKNTMSVTSAIVAASMRHATSLEEARDTTTSRIQALARTQSLLSRPDDHSNVADIVRETIAPYVDDRSRVAIAGPAVTVSSRQAVGLSLAIYELATNAIKYGALSVDGGSVGVRWEQEDGHRFTFSWTESGGPPVAEPGRKGFGTRLTNDIVAAYFNGTGETVYHPDGLRFVLRGTLRPPADDAPSREGAG